MTIELEIKSLVENPTKLQTKIESKYDMSLCTKTYSEQLNHYFSGDKEALIELSTYGRHAPYLIFDSYLDELLSASKLAVRTRWDSIQGTLLIFKYSLIDENSINGTTRKELEFPLPITLEELDKNLLLAGFTYQSKWSRKRTQYSFDSGWTLCCDQNAGFGSILEVEYIATEEEYAEKKDYLMYKAKRFLKTLGLIELDSKLLEKMFNWYSSNYNEFYGTDKLIWNDPAFPYRRDGTHKYTVIR